MIAVYAETHHDCVSWGAIRIRRFFVRPVAKDPPVPRVFSSTSRLTVQGRAHFPPHHPSVQPHLNCPPG